MNARGGSVRPPGEEEPVSDVHPNSGGCPVWCQTQHKDEGTNPDGHDGPTWRVHDPDGRSIEMTTGTEDGRAVLRVTTFCDEPTLDLEGARLLRSNMHAAGQWLDERQARTRAKPEGHPI